MKRQQISKLLVAIIPLLVVVSGCQPASELEQQADSDQMPMNERLVPQFEVDPSWPTLPNDWVLGSVASVDVDSRAHVWIYHRPRSVDEEQRGNAAPAVLEFDSEGNFVQGWGGPGDGYEWPANEHGIEVDDQDYVWLGGNSGGETSDDMLLKFTRDGKIVMQIGGRNTSEGNTDTDNLNRPSEAAVYSDTNEVFVADGYGNRRVIVFDAVKLSLLR